VEDCASSNNGLSAPVKTKRTSYKLVEYYSESLLTPTSTNFFKHNILKQHILFILVLMVSYAVAY